MVKLHFIREARAEDARGLENCMQCAYADYQQQLGAVRLPPMDANYAVEIEHYPTWVVESNGDIVGGLIMVFDNQEASVANVAVNPAFQGQGIGAELLRFAENKAREKNYAVLRLATHNSLQDNVSLYRHLGWQETGRDETRVYMEKAL